ncbi:hypothetical protein ES703_79412 [subsurface metagenome]
MVNDYIVMQVRLSSKRLPNKLLLSLKGTSIFEHILIRLKMVKTVSGLVVATTAGTEQLIRDIAHKYGTFILIGKEDDVLSRFSNAVKKYNMRNVVRATGDNPLVDIEYIDKALMLHRRKNADLTTYPLLPYGTGVEVIRGDVLIKIDNLTSDPYEREHITQYIYRHKDAFNIVRGTPDNLVSRPDIRLTVDTRDDYTRMVDIYENIYDDMPIKLTDVIAYIDRIRI